jgi:multiple sugar transport system substrate-binding protein
MKPPVIAVAMAMLTGAAATPTAAQQSVLFWSNQGTPVQEQQAIREQVLSGFAGKVEFSPQDPGPFMTRIGAELQAGKGTIALIGGLHGDFASFPDGLIDLAGVSPASVKVNDAYVALGKLGTNQQKYLPWMQATYMMAADKKALPYLPAGADINRLTYDQLIAWAKTLAEKTGGPKFGLPAGPRGLIHRFVQGFIYPSYTKSMVTQFRSPEAVAMWGKMKELWSVTNPASTNYGFMQEQLLSGEVWLAWDHTARLQDALNQKPNDFVVFPVPAGPAGRGFMPVVAGLAIPKTSPDPDGAKKLVQYLLQPTTQVAMLKAIGFYPVVTVDLPADMPAAVKQSGPVIAAQTTAKDAIPALLPVGLGDEGGKFNKVYTDTFQRILLANQDVKTVLDQQAAVLKEIMTTTKAPCWAPDPASAGPCPVN